MFQTAAAEHRRDFESRIGVLRIAAIVFFADIGVRPDFFEAARTSRFLFKFVVTVSLAVTAIGAVLALGRPDGRFAPRGLKATNRAPPRSG